MKMMTFMPLEEINEYEALEGSEVNRAKEKLAWELTQVVHGKAAADEALLTAQSLFGAGGDNLESAPTFNADRRDLGRTSIVDLLTVSGCFTSKGEVRRLIAQNGLQVGDRKVSSPDWIVTPDLVGADGTILVKKGKKHYYRIAFSD